MVTATGIGSGLDINAILDQLIAVERRPLQLLDQKESRLQAQLSAYGIVKGSLSTLQSAIAELGRESNYQATRTSLSDNTHIAVSSDATATPGSHSIEVKQLARQQKLASAAFATPDVVLGTGTLTIQPGRFDGATFVPNPDEGATVILIDPSNNTLEGVRSAINKAGLGASASILDDGTGYRLVISSRSSGAANSLKITVSTDGDGNDFDAAGLSALAFDPAAAAGAGRNLLETQAAQDALLRVDGIDDIARGSNTVADLIAGLTITLARVNLPGEATVVTVDRDLAPSISAVRSLVKSYNEYGRILGGFTAFDSETGQAGLLQGDVSSLNILSRVRASLTAAFDNGSGITSLSQLGVSFGADGLLALDEAKLEAALASSQAGVASFLASRGSAGDALIRFVDAGDNTQPGQYLVNLTQLAARAALTGQATAALASTAGTGTFDNPVVIDGGNDAFELLVDGVSSGPIVLGHGSYANAAALVAEIQSRIDSMQALAETGIRVEVAFDDASDRLTITSGRFGSASKVQVLAAGPGFASTFGFAEDDVAAGVDVAGTIGGSPATGAGRFLTGAAGGNTEGLRIEVLGGNVGIRASVTYTHGLARRLNRDVAGLLGESGPVASRSDGIRNRIADIDRQRESAERRLVELEERLRAQFTALDALIGRLTTTSNFLAQQFAGLRPPESGF
jgi:flagellar hook-associated protein 2